MPSSINASTAGAGGVITTADNSGVLQVQTAGTTALSISASQVSAFSGNLSTTGSLGVGTASPTEQFHVQGTVNSGTVRARVQNSSATSSTADLIVNAGTNSSFIQILSTYNGTGYLLFSTSLTSGQIATVGAAPLVFGTSNTERMRIEPTYGTICAGVNTPIVANTQSFAAAAYTLSLRNTQTSAGQFWVTGPNSSNHYCVFNQDSTGVYVLNGGTSWSGQSDERLKTDLTPILDGLAKVNSLRSVTGRFKTDEVGKSRSFLIAQDVQKVLPEAVNEFNGNLGVQYTDTIPLLVAAIKELSAKVDAQAAEIAALKAGA